MRSTLFERSLVTLLLGSAVLASAAAAVDRMVGLVPSNGVAMFVKVFTVSEGTVITGMQFTSNDPTTVFPSVVLVRGPVGSGLAGGTTVASAANVQEASGSLVTVTWSSAISVTETGTYYVGVCPPSGAGKQSVGHGPALGANDAATPDGSYIASGMNGELCPVAADLAISLLTSGGGGQLKANFNDDGPPPPQTAARTFLLTRSTSSGALVDFGIAPDRTDVSIRVYGVSGRLMRELVRGTFTRGAYNREWDGKDQNGRDVAAGVYFVRMVLPSLQLKQKVVLAR